ncbi:MAG: hypothetical protein U5L96_19185 [Owenweeksia sp.]|nr:hypothetical protein [Owenweeksia sp.]
MAHFGLGDTSICAGQAMEVINRSSGFSTYTRFSMGDDQTYENQNMVRHTYQQPGRYTSQSYAPATAEIRIAPL